jgi:hypothetical protein
LGCRSLSELNAQRNQEEKAAETGIGLRCANVKTTGGHLNSEFWGAGQIFYRDSEIEGLARRAGCAAVN